MPDVLTGGEEQAETQDLTPTDESPVQAPTSAQGTGPWAKDLSEFFADEDTRTQVDGFLREKVQPYVTKLEGERPPEQAVQLYSDLQDDPASTFLVLTEDLFGPEVAQSVVEALTVTPDIEDPAVSEPSDTEQSLNPRVAKWVQKMEEDEQAQEYDRVIDAIIEFDSEVNRDLIDPFVIAADGDPQSAYSAYKQWIETARAGYTPAETNEPAAEAQTGGGEEAPAVIGSDVQTPSAPPTQKQYGADQLDEALDDFLAEANSKSSVAPGTVGAV